jgi:hypothetical protein
VYTTVLASKAAVLGDEPLIHGDKPLHPDVKVFVLSQGQLCRDRGLESSLARIQAAQDPEVSESLAINRANYTAPTSVEAVLAARLYREQTLEQRPELLLQDHFTERVARRRGGYRVLDRHWRKVLKAGATHVVYGAAKFKSSFKRNRAVPTAAAAYRMKVYFHSARAGLKAQQDRVRLLADAAADMAAATSWQPRDVKLDARRQRRRARRARRREKLLKREAVTVMPDIDEYDSSKITSCCGVRAHSVKLVGEDPRGHRSQSQVTRNFVYCGCCCRILGRDVQAALNLVLEGFNQAFGTPGADGKVPRLPHIAFNRQGSGFLSPKIIRGALRSWAEVISTAFHKAKQRKGALLVKERAAKQARASSLEAKKSLEDPFGRAVAAIVKAGPMTSKAKARSLAKVGAASRAATARPAATAWAATKARFLEAVARPTAAALRPAATAKFLAKIRARAAALDATLAFTVVADKAEIAAATAARLLAEKKEARQKYERAQSRLLELKAARLQEQADRRGDKSAKQSAKAAVAAAQKLKDRVASATPDDFDKLAKSAEDALGRASKAVAESKSKRL